MSKDRETLLKELDLLRRNEKMAEKELDWKRASCRSPDAPAEAAQRVKQAEEELRLSRHALAVWIDLNGPLLAGLTRRVIRANGNTGQRIV